MLNEILKQVQDDIKEEILKQVERDKLAHLRFQDDNMGDDVFYRFLPSKKSIGVCLSGGCQSNTFLSGLIFSILTFSISASI